MRVLCNGSKSDCSMKDMSINPKKVGGRNFEEEFGQALFVYPTPQYAPRETKTEPDRRLSLLLEINELSFRFEMTSPLSHWLQDQPIVVS